MRVFFMRLWKMLDAADALLDVKETASLPLGSELSVEVVVTLPSMSLI